MWHMYDKGFLFRVCRDFLQIKLNENKTKKKPLEPSQRNGGKLGIALERRGFYKRTKTWRFSTSLVTREMQIKTRVISQ